MNQPMPPPRLTPWRDRALRVVDLDRRALILIGQLERRWLTPLMRALTRAGDPAGWILLTFGWALLSWPTPDLALRVGAGSGLGALAAWPLKRALRRARPSASIPGLEALAGNPDAFSFPSGHTASAVGAACALMGTGATAPFALLAVGIAASRVYLRAHYPLDVLAGAVLGALSGWAWALWGAPGVNALIAGAF